MSESNPRQKTSVFMVCTALLLWGLLISVIVPFNCNGKWDARRAGSISNLKQIALAHEAYVADFDGFGPPPVSWADSLAPYTSPRTVDYKKNYSLNFWSPHDDRQVDGDGNEFGYAYFRPLGGVQVSSIAHPADVPIVFDSSDLRWNANGDLSLLPDPPRWNGKNLIAFLDGHVRAEEGTPRVEIKLP